MWYNTAFLPISHCLRVQRFSPLSLPFPTCPYDCRAALLSALSPRVSVRVQNLASLSLQHFDQIGIPEKKYGRQIMAGDERGFRWVLPDMRENTQTHEQASGCRVKLHSAEGESCDSEVCLAAVELLCSSSRNHFVRVQEFNLLHEVRVRLFWDVREGGKGTVIMWPNRLFLEPVNYYFFLYLLTCCLWHSCS